MKQDSIDGRSPAGDAVKRLKGIDVSQLNGVIDWQQVKAAGYEFAFLKTSEGAVYVDETFANNRRAARAAGLAVGYYHFFRPDADVEAQVTNFVHALGQLESDALRPVLRCEDPKLWVNQTVKERVEKLIEWCTKVKRILGVSPIIYGNSQFFIDVLGNASELQNYELWIASPDAEQPGIPKPWTSWLFWQFAQKGKIDGITGDVNENWYNGTDINKARAKPDEVLEPQQPDWLVSTLWYCAVTLYFIGFASVLWEHFFQH